MFNIIRSKVNSSFLRRVDSVLKTSPQPVSGCRALSVSGVDRKTFEPDYLDSSVPQIPTYPEINIQVREKCLFLKKSTILFNQKIFPQLNVRAFII